MKKQLNVQVDKSNYFDKYDTIQRFAAYYYQIKLIKELQPETLLEIGIGNKTVFDYLKRCGINNTSCDFDRELNPDVIADIRDLPFEDNSFETVMACEVLEHIPWEDLDKALSEIYRVCNRYVLITLPYSSIKFEFIARLPFLDKKLPSRVLRLYMRIPLIFLPLKFKKLHYWEIGRKHYPIRKIRKKLKQYFRIMKEVVPIMNINHHFFVLEKKQ